MKENPYQSTILNKIAGCYYSSIGWVIGLVTANTVTTAMQVWFSLVIQLVLSAQSLLICNMYLCSWLYSGALVSYSHGANWPWANWRMIMLELQSGLAQGLWPIIRHNSRYCYTKAYAKAAKRLWIHYFKLLWYLLVNTDKMAANVQN